MSQGELVIKNGSAYNRAVRVVRPIRSLQVAALTSTVRTIPLMCKIELHQLHPGIHNFSYWSDVTLFCT